MRVLITGGSGYLGGLTAKHLQTLQYDDLGCIVRSEKRKGVLGQLAKPPELLIADQHLDKAISRFSPDCVINIAGTYGRDHSDAELIEGNFLFPLHVLQCAKQSGIKRWVNVDTALPATLNAYSLSKASFVEWGRYYCNNQIHFLNLSVEQFYGPGQPDTYFLSWVIEKLKHDEPVFLTKGTQKRDFIFVDDVVNAITAAISLETNDWFCEIPVCSGEAPTIREVVEYLKSLTHSTSKLVFGAVPMRDGEPNSSCDFSGMRLLGIQNVVNWKDGLKTLL